MFLEDEEQKRGITGYFSAVMEGCGHSRLGYSHSQLYKDIVGRPEMIRVSKLFDKVSWSKCVLLLPWNW